MEEGEAFIQLNDVGRVFVTRCIQLIESKGVDTHEGLYRLVGSSARVKKYVVKVLLCVAFDSRSCVCVFVCVSVCQGWQKIQNFEKIHGWMDKIGFIWIKYGDFFKNGFFQKYLTNV